MLTIIGFIIYIHLMGLLFYLGYWAGDNSALRSLLKDSHRELHFIETGAWLPVECKSRTFWHKLYWNVLRYPLWPWFLGFAFGAGKKFSSFELTSTRTLLEGLPDRIENAFGRSPTWNKFLRE